MKAFVIGLSRIESSNSTAQNVVKQLKDYGLDVEFFEGTYGNDAVQQFKKENRRIAKYGIKSKKLSLTEYKKIYPDAIISNDVTEIIVRLETSEEENIGKILRPGVMGCFYSHYRLWEKCIELNEPILVFEDDVIFERGFIPVEWKDVLLLCTGKKAHEHWFYKELLYNPSGDPAAVPLRNTSLPGTVGYGITPSGAKKLVEAYKEEFLPSDTSMNCFVVDLECHTYLMGRASIDSDGKESLTKSKIWGTFNDDTSSIG